MNGSKCVLTGMTIAALVLLSACGFFPKEKEQKLTLPEPPKVATSVTYPVERGDMAEQIEGTAQVNPIREQALYFLVSGRVQTVTVAPDDEVKKGQAIATLEIDALEHQLALAKIDLEVARLQRLKFSTAAPIDQKLADLILARQQENVNYLQKQVDAARIIAPFSGIVRRVNVKVSDQVQEYQPVVELSDPSNLEIQLPVSENDFNFIEPRMRSEVLYSTDSWMLARIVQTSHRDPRFDATVQRDEYTVHLQLLDASLQLKPYYRLPVRIIERESKNTLVIPAAGLREFNGRTYVRVLEGEVRREVDVKVGIRSDTKVEILEGLKEGDQVIGK